ncbi:hypothetical protein ACLB2K_052957 [Fragaria x ananassa]
MDQCFVNGALLSFFVASWTGVVKYHGPRPSIRPKQVFVANHTSMIDFIILEQVTAFAVIMQKHPGWVGKRYGLYSFPRLRDHVVGPDNNPLIFPKGTCVIIQRTCPSPPSILKKSKVCVKWTAEMDGCAAHPGALNTLSVNNHYTVMFKKGAFELGCSVCPVAIKYNKIFVDAFWNSRKQSFTMHLLQLMTSWAVVCDVWYLEPENIMPGETAIEFAERVRDIISV